MRMSKLLPEKSTTWCFTKQLHIPLGFEYNLDFIAEMKVPLHACTILKQVSKDLLSDQSVLFVQTALRLW